MPPRFRFEQDPGELPAIEQDVVRPFAAQLGERRCAATDSIAEAKRRSEAKLVGLRRRAVRAQDDRDEEIAGKADPLPATSAASRRLLVCPDDGPLLRSQASQSFRLVVGARQPVVAQQTIGNRQVGLSAHPAKSAAAAASAPVSSGPGTTKNSSTSTAVTTRMVRISPLIGRSNAPVASSKYISLTMRR